MQLSNLKRITPDILALVHDNIDKTVALFTEPGLPKFGTITKERR